MKLPPLIALVGFMGAGKTTVGKILADGLGYEFVDTDDLIVAAASAPIADIFRREGEASFRRRETEALRSLEGRSRTVIAAGGGAPVQEANRDFFQRHARTFHLRVSMENARNRAQAPGAPVRPLLSQEEAAVRQLYAYRRSIYEAIGQPVETDGCSPQQVAAEIMGILNPRES